MEHDFWQTAWDEGRIGFHQSAVNPYLQRYWSRLNAAHGAKVFVPMCGKSRDMLWLREQGHKVVGVEVVERAVEDFFAENGIDAARRPSGPFVLWSAEDIEIYQGDFFDLTPETAAGIEAVFDRASLIALPPAMRQRYAAHLRAILPAQINVLLVTMEYPQAEMNGPPFAVTENEVAMLYADAFDIERVGSSDVLAANPHFRERGLSRLTEKIYVLRGRQPGV
jgi:thiopurine S-methyltransferase